VSGIPAGGVLDPVSDDHVVGLVPTPSWSLVKASSTAPAAAGETIQYSFTVVNTGNVTVSNVALADAKCATPIVLDAEVGAATPTPDLDPRS